MSLILDNLSKYFLTFGKTNDSTSQGFTTVGGITVPNNFMWNMFNFPLLVIQATALDEGVGLSSTLLTNIYGRVYVKNDTGDDIDFEYPECMYLTIGGVPTYRRGSVTLRDGVTYAMHPDTAKWFIQKALEEEDEELDYVDQTEWLSSGSEMVFGS